jgi:hypothetical protein
LKREFEIDRRYSVGNIHIELTGEFSGSCAWALMKTIKRQPNYSGRVFVNTRNLRNVTPEGVELFKLYMTRKKIPRDWLYFKGEKGFEISPDGGRVLVDRKPCTAKNRTPGAFRTSSQKTHINTDNPEKRRTK